MLATDIVHIVVLHRYHRVCVYTSIICLFLAWYINSIGLYMYQYYVYFGANYRYFVYIQRDTSMISVYVCTDVMYIVLHRYFQGNTLILSALAPYLGIVNVIYWYITDIVYIFSVIHLSLCLYRYCTFFQRNTPILSMWYAGIIPILVISSA